MANSFDRCRQLKGHELQIDRHPNRCHCLSQMPIGLRNAYGDLL
jgi:hypothetical protein